MSGSPASTQSLALLEDLAAAGELMSGPVMKLGEKEEGQRKGGERRRKTRRRVVWGGQGGSLHLHPPLSGKGGGGRDV